VVNASLNWASIVGIVLAVGGALLYFMRSFKPALARDYDVFFAAVGLLCGGILFFQGWRLDPILQFGQFLLAGTTVFFAYESVRLRGVTTEQARRSSYFDDDEPAPRPRMGGGRDWGEGLDRFDEPQPLRRRIRSRDEGYDEREDDDFYRPRRPAPRAAIPERAASRGERSGANERSGPSDDWDQGDARSSGGATPSRFRAGGGPASSAPEFGSRRQSRDEQPRRGSRPGATAEDLPRSSRRPVGGPSTAAATTGTTATTPGIPQGTPYQQRPGTARPAAAPAGERDISDADFRAIPPSSRPSGRAPRDNSSRFDD